MCLRSHHDGTRPGAEREIHPCALAHVVFRSADPDRLVDWYCHVLGAHVVLRHPMISFITWDHSQDRIAFVPLRNGQEPTPRQGGRRPRRLRDGVARRARRHLSTARRRGHRADPLLQPWCRDVDVLPGSRRQRDRTERRPLSRRRRPQRVSRAATSTRTRPASRSMPVRSPPRWSPGSTRQHSCGRIPRTVRGSPT